MVVAVLPGRQHVDDLGALLHETANPLAPDLLDHSDLLHDAARHPARPAISLRPRRPPARAPPPHPSPTDHRRLPRATVVRRNFRHFAYIGYFRIRSFAVKLSLRLSARLSAARIVWL